MRYSIPLVLVATFAGADTWKDPENYYLLGFRDGHAVWIRSDGGGTRIDKKIRLVQGGVLSRDVREGAFVKDEDLWICNADGTGGKRLLEGALEPSWSRTGKFILCVVNGHIRRVERATGKVDGFGAGNKPRLNSTDTLLASLDGGRLVVMNVADRTRRVLAEGVTDFAWYMSASEKIVWAGADGVHIHDAINDKSLRVVPYMAGLKDPRAYAFAWNYPEMAVAFRMKDAKTGASDGSIRIVGLTGKPRTLPIPNGLSVTDPRWMHISRWQKRIW